MTAYHGGKKRIGEEIAQVISEICEKCECYIEPFCGMLGVYQHIPTYIQAKYYLAGDANESVIEMWKQVQKGWKPPTKCSTKKYKQLKENGRVSAEKGFLGHALGFRGIYFNTQRNDVNLKRISYQVSDMKETIQDVHFFPGSFDQFSNFKNSIIYCDPPYIVQAVYRDEYGKNKTFDYESFYIWAKGMARHNVVFISERVNKLPIPSKVVAKFKDDEKLFILI